MSYSQSLWLYLMLLTGIMLVPGMDFLFVLTNTLLGGRARGLAAVGGIMTGGAFHALIGTLAVGFLLILPPVLITAVIFAGAAYMASIGVTLLRSSITIGAIGKAADRSLAIAYRQGLLTTLLNPKGYLFVVAVYPQFIKPQFGPVWQQGVIMGAMLMLTMLAVYGVLILAAGSARTFLSAHPNVTIAFGRAAGALFIIVAAITAWHAMSIA